SHSRVLQISRHGIADHLTDRLVHSTHASRAHPTLLQFRVRAGVPARAYLFTARSGCQLALDLPRLVALEHVALVQILEVLEHDSALEAVRDLARVVVEAPQARDRRVEDDGAVAHDAHTRTARDLALSDEGAGDRADFRSFEELTDLGLAERRL